MFMIADHIIDKVEANKAIKLKEIINIFQKYYGVLMSYHKVYRAKDITIKRIHGSFEKSFNELNDYILELHKTNPGTRTFFCKGTRR